MPDIDHLLRCYGHRPEFFWPKWEALIADMTPEQVQEMMAGRSLPEPVPRGFLDAAHLCMPRPHER
jgi:hypothetical protein